MRTLVLAAALGLSGAAAQAEVTTLPDPIAPAALGQWQCYQPNTQRKTCSSLASYRRRPDGSIENIVIILVSRNPTVTMELSAPIEIKDGQVCGTMLQSQVDAAKFAVRGQTLDQAQIAQLRQRVVTVSEKFFGHESCTAYEDLGLNLIAKESMDGKPLDIVLPVIWVRQDEGYEVRP